MMEMLPLKVYLCSVWRCYLLGIFLSNRCCYLYLCKVFGFLPLEGVWIPIFIILVFCSNSIFYWPVPVPLRKRPETCMHYMHISWNNVHPADMFIQQRLTCLYSISFSLLKIVTGIKHTIMFTDMLVV